jgi:hypothetical protein
MNPMIDPVINKPINSVLLENFCLAKISESFSFITFCWSKIYCVLSSVFFIDSFTSSFWVLINYISVSWFFIARPKTWAWALRDSFATCMFLKACCEGSYKAKKLSKLLKSLPLVMICFMYKNVYIWREIHEN